MARNIIEACLYSGLFKLSDGPVAFALPKDRLPRQVIQSGVDKVCANPVRYAHDAGTLSWVIENLRAYYFGIKVL